MGEAEVLVKKCKCASKKAIEKAIADFNAKSKAANTAAWKKSYHMICVLDAKPANKCTVPALPEVKPVPFGKGVKDSCVETWMGKPIPNRCHTGFDTFKGPYIKTLDKSIGYVEKFTTSPHFVSGGWANPGKKFKLIRLQKHSFPHSSGKAEMDYYVNSCRRLGLLAVGCGSSKSYDAGECPWSVAMPNAWGCNMLTKLKTPGGMGNSIIALQERIGNNAALYALNSN